MKAIAVPARTKVPSGLDHEELAVAARRAKRRDDGGGHPLHAPGPGAGRRPPLALRARRRRRSPTRSGSREAMTYKAAAAGLDLGGGKGVICAPSAEPPGGELRRAILHDFGDLVESLGGRYITAEDVGTATEDMVEIATRTTHVTGMPVERGGAGDPSPFTALGVQAAMRARLQTRVRHAATSPAAASPSSGLGHVGATARARPRRSGRRADALRHRPGKARDRRRARRRLAGARRRARRRARRGRAVRGRRCDPRPATSARCAAASSAARPTTSSPTRSSPKRLARRGILYAPDFIANAGGLINVYRELHRYDANRALELVLRIERVMTDVFEHADDAGTTPLEAARALARRRLDAATR